MRKASVLLSHGIKTNGSTLKIIQLRELNGYDQQQLFEMADYSQFSRLRNLLELVVDLKGTSDTGINLINQLTMGDLVALILQLRRITFGEYMNCIITCLSCGDVISVQMTVGQLLQPPLVECSGVCRTKVGEFTLELRQPSAAEIQRLTETASGMCLPESLIRMCVVSSEPHLPAHIDDELLKGISLKLAELDPQADLVLDVCCPSCEHRFQAPFYPEKFVLDEIDSRQSQFENEIHWLAFNYHWCEHDILSLAISKRKRYLELISNTLSGRSLE